MASEAVTDEAENTLNNNILPEKSRQKYNQVYKKFLEWQIKKKTSSFSENTLLTYFNELSKDFKPSTLWSFYSMLRSKLNIEENIDISTYKTLLSFLKNQSKGFTSKKSKLFTPKDLQKFFAEAPDEKFLVIKIAAIFGIHGECRLKDLINIVVENIQQHGEVIVVNIPKAKNGVSRSFTIQGQFVQLLLKYQALRPTYANTHRFFLSMRNDKCTVQPIGQNTFTSMPKKIAEYLKLTDPNLYTSYSFRRTSNILLADGSWSLTNSKSGNSTAKSITETKERDYNSFTSNIDNSYNDDISQIYSICKYELNISDSIDSSSETEQPNENNLTPNNENSVLPNSLNKEDIEYQADIKAFSEFVYYELVAIKDLEIVNEIKHNICNLLYAAKKQYLQNKKS